MNEAEFTQTYLQIINLIAETIENNDPDGDIDIDLNADILTISNDKGTYVINKQSSIKEIWLSSPVSGPYHFKNIATKWIAKDGDNLLEILSSELGIAINF